MQRLEFIERRDQAIWSGVRNTEFAQWYRSNEIQYFKRSGSQGVSLCLVSQQEGEIKGLLGGIKQIQSPV